MIIKVNSDYEFEVPEKYLTVKDRKLYNTKTKTFEGVEGDIISFQYIKDDGTKGGLRGYIDGYTNGEVVKIRGIEKTYKIDGKYSVEHISSVTDFTDESVVKAEITEI